MQDWLKEVQEESRPYYRKIVNAIRSKIPDDIPRDSEEYQDVSYLCGACLLATLIDGHEKPDWIIERILYWPRGYSCWLGDVEQAIEKADLSFVENEAEFKAELRGALCMAKAWIWHIEHPQ
ncbi:MAG: hypothetical protein QM808_17855 [Steroidobacteraceae bacterium]